MSLLKKLFSRSPSDLSDDARLMATVKGDNDISQLEERLSELAALTRTKPRAAQVADEKASADKLSKKPAQPAVSQPEKPEEPNKQDSSKTQPQTNSKAKPKAVVHHWAKGTGFGNANRQTTTTWDISSYISSAAAKEKKMSRLCEDLTSSLSSLFSAAEPNDKTTAAIHVIEKSCLLPFLQERLSNGSLIDLERRHVSVQAVLALTETLAQKPYTAHLLVIPSHPEDKHSQLFKILRGLSTQIEHVEKKEQAMLKRASVVAKEKADKDKANNKKDDKNNTKKSAKTPRPAPASKSVSATDKAFVALTSKIMEVATLVDSAIDTIDKDVLDMIRKDDASRSPSTASVEPDIDLDLAPLDLERVSSEQKAKDDAAGVAKTPSHEQPAAKEATSAGGKAVASVPEAPAPADKPTAPDTVKPTAKPLIPGVPLAPPMKEDIVATAVETKHTDTEEQKKLNAELDAKYVAMMRPLQAGEVEELSGHKYEKTNSDKNQVWSRKWIRRVATEYQEMSRSLPLYAHSSVFFRYHEEKMCFAQLMISGPEDTPYSGGLFLFDVFLPANYPNTAPKCNLQTTGKGSVRFNPNLYNCGKVCLSLLGTWGGDAHESWNPATSTLLQLAVSIQSLVLVPEPYFNEPGYERQMGQERGRTNSDNYNRKIEAATVRWAMLDMLKNPPKGFEEVVRNHFALRQHAILKEVESWMAKKDRTELKALHAQLKTEFAKLTLVE